MKDEESNHSASVIGPSTSTEMHEIAQSGTPQALGKRSKEKRLKDKILQDQKGVKSARRAIYAIIVLSAFIICVSIYIINWRANYATFASEYEVFSQDIIKLVQWENKYNFALMEQLSASITSDMIEHQDSASSYFTVPHFEIKAGFTEGLSGISAVAFAPLVRAKDRAQWESYAANNNDWLVESGSLKLVHPGHENPLEGTIQDHESGTSFRSEVFSGNTGVSERISRYDEDGNTVPEADREASTTATFGTSAAQDVLPFAPIWQTSPPSPSSVNVDLFTCPALVNLYKSIVVQGQTVLSNDIELKDMFTFAYGDSDFRQNSHNFIMTPVYDSFGIDKELVGVLVGLTALDTLLEHVVPDNVHGILGVFEDACGDVLTYELNGSEFHALEKGRRDLHDPKFDQYKRSTVVEIYDFPSDGLCQHTLNIYPTKEFRNRYTSTKELIKKSAIVGLAFLVTASLLLVYDFFITRRQDQTMKSAVRAGVILESIYPDNVREALFEDYDNKNSSSNEEKKPLMSTGSFLKKGRPIAEFFPNATIMFADIAGFTAWASTREPFQVFSLLEAIYGEFDLIAKRRRIFKVETVGDCYVAVCGVPTPRHNHAVCMARFARDCLFKMSTMREELEIALGPDTSNLAFRVGLHSGPVTGGVLRGENARFQLFGDTVNTASRMESSGERNRVHVSGATAALLREFGKGHWLQEREDLVAVKGKGEMLTYWLNMSNRRSSIGTSDTATSSSGGDSHFEINSALYLGHDSVLQSAYGDKINRLITWSSDMLLALLKQVIASRGQLVVGAAPKADPWSVISSAAGSALNEVKETVELPRFKADQTTVNPDDVELTEQVEGEMVAFIETIAYRYKQNAFHCFEHAAHVTMSVSKLLGRIVEPSDFTVGEESDGSKLHNSTYGITSDPLTQFACILSALIHDVDHPGVPNSQLVEEAVDLAVKYNGKSVAEQHSIDLTWSFLMEPRFANLRNALCSAEDEVRRFRQLVVNSVIATDIMDKDLKALRNGRWTRAFTESPDEKSPSSLALNRKATIVIEHLIQASDVAHTMQHWHVYRKWNERLFFEMYAAYEAGRTDKNPAEFWYEGEIAFFDYYIIPLAEKLHQCGVFGVSSDEYLAYAEKNKIEWQARGKELVADMVAAAIKMEDAVKEAPARSLSMGSMI